MCGIFCKTCIYVPDGIYINKTYQGGTIMSNDVLMELKATNGTIIAYEDRVVISRQTFGGIFSQGFKGDRTFFYKDLTSVEYKKPGMINGYLQFITAGTISANPGVGLFGTSTQSLKDNNTVILRAFNENVPADSEKLYNLILSKMTEYKNISTVASNSSSADELMKFKNLLDQGIINQEEFDAKKKQLLGL